ncbi:hypothetical protein HanIR_Chr04g0197181 [Helianthus annuus]|nr:hypothetical protein HanIR_Chr04g0197181 [Helianthus annuus]
MGEWLPKRGGGERESLTNQKFPFFFFFLKKKTIHLRGECRHQFRVLGELTWHTRIGWA